MRNTSTCESYGRRIKAMRFKLCSTRCQTIERSPNVSLFREVWVSDPKKVRPDLSLANRPTSHIHISPLFALFRIMWLLDLLTPYSRGKLWYGSANEWQVRTLQDGSHHTEVSSLHIALVGWLVTIFACKMSRSRHMKRTFIVMEDEHDASHLPTPAEMRTLANCGRLRELEFSGNYATLRMKELLVRAFPDQLRGVRMDRWAEFWYSPCSNWVRSMFDACLYGSLSIKVAVLQDGWKLTSLATSAPTRPGLRRKPKTCFQKLP